jgi:hypothetical protein
MTLNGAHDLTRLPLEKARRDSPDVPVQTL